MITTQELGEALYRLYLGAEIQIREVVDSGLTYYKIRTPINTGILIGQPDTYYSIEDAERAKFISIAEYIISLCGRMPTEHLVIEAANPLRRLETEFVYEHHASADAPHIHTYILSYTRTGRLTPFFTTKFDNLDDLLKAKCMWFARELLIGLYT